MPEASLPTAGQPMFAPAEDPAPARRMLGAMAGIALFGHALGFYVLQAFYTPAGALPPTSPPARLTLVPAGTPEAAALERWLAVADPALGADATLPRPESVLAALPPVPYVPSFQARSPANPGDLGDLAFAGRGPTPAGSVLPPRPVLPMRKSLPPAAPPPDPPHTRVVLPEALRRRLPPGQAPPFPPLSLPVTTLAELPRPTAFLVGARPEGGVPLVFRETSSGVAAADDAARAALENLPFTPDERAPLTWGRVTVFWGRETFR